MSGHPHAPLKVHLIVDNSCTHQHAADRRPSVQL